MTVRILAPAVDIETLVRHRRRFLRFVERYVANRDDAEDILQAALATSLEKGGGLRRGESVAAWFYLRPLRKGASRWNGTAW
ncbi:MAG: sigma factor [Gemmatimonadales bacterium]